MKEGALAITQEDHRTSPLSGQATTNLLLCHPMLLACHSRAALDRPNSQLRIRISWDTMRHG
jgi:hypothetical protein